MDKEIILIESIYDCCGCAACYSICSQRAITMVEDKEGFLFPRIDKDKCVCCKRCINVCPLKKEKVKW